MVAWLIPLFTARAQRDGGGDSQGGMHMGPRDHLLTFLGPGRRAQSLGTGSGLGPRGSRGTA